MGQQHDFYLVQTGNLVPRSASWRGFLACFQQPNPLRSANLDSSDSNRSPRVERSGTLGPNPIEEKRDRTIQRHLLPAPPDSAKPPAAGTVR